MKSVVFIHGLLEKKRNGYVDWLAGLLNTHYKKIDSSISTKNGNLLHFEGENEAIKLSEFYYFDHIKEQEYTKLKWWQQPLHSLTVINYWFNSGIWHAVRQNKTLMVGVLGSGLALIIWFVSTLFFAITVLPSAFDTQYVEDVRSFVHSFDWSWINPSVKKFIRWVSPSLEAVRAFSTSALIIFLTGTPIFRTIVRVSSFSMNFMSQPNLRNRVIRELEVQINEELENPEIDQVHLVAHSMGTLVLLEYLKRISLNPVTDKKVSAVFIGGALTFLARKEPRINEDIDAVANGSQIAFIDDIYSTEDWFCTYVDKSKEDQIPDGKIRTTELQFGTPWYLRATNRVHVDAYFESMRVLKKIVAG